VCREQLLEGARVPPERPRASMSLALEIRRRAVLPTSSASRDPGRSPADAITVLRRAVLCEFRSPRQPNAALAKHGSEPCRLRPVRAKHYGSGTVYGHVVRRRARVGGQRVTGAACQAPACEALTDATDDSVSRPALSWTESRLSTHALWGDHVSDTGIGMNFCVGAWLGWPFGDS
jgi:hypothetical protein